MYEIILAGIRPDWFVQNRTVADLNDQSFWDCNDFGDEFKGTGWYHSNEETILIQECGLERYNVYGWKRPAVRNELLKWIENLTEVANMEVRK